MILPGAQELFEKYFLPWCDGDEKPSLGMPLGKPQNLRADYEGLLKDYLNETLPGAAREAYRPVIAFNSFDETILTAIDAYYTPARIIPLIEESDPDDFANDYLTAVSHFAAMLSALFLQRPGFGWQYAHPYFQSVIIHHATGRVIPVFEWALVKFSGDGIPGNVMAKYRQAIL
jgi:hypothetical protein